VHEGIQEREQPGEQGEEDVPAGMAPARSPADQPVDPAEQNGETAHDQAGHDQPDREILPLQVV
jgi:hypothetical protein